MNIIDEKNRKIANLLGIKHRMQRPDFYTSDEANTLVLDALLAVDGLGLHMMRRDGQLHITMFVDCCDAGTTFKGDRKTAVCEAFLAWSATKLNRADG